MKPFIPLFNSPEENRFKTIAEFKNCLQWGAKLELEWKGVTSESSAMGWTTKSPPISGIRRGLTAFSTLRTMPWNTV